MRKLQKIFGAAILTAMFVSCSGITTPKKISVKTKADFNFTLANFEKDLGEYLSLETLQNAVAGQKSMKVYDYNPAGSADADIAQFLLEMPVGDAIELDMSTYIQNDLFNDEVKFEQKFSVPEVKKSENMTLSVDALKSNFNNLVSFYGPVGSGSQTVSVNFENANEKFDTLEYTSGTMYVFVEDVTGLPATVNFCGEMGNFEDITTTSVTKPSKNFTISGYSINPDFKYVAKIDLAGKTLSLLNPLTIEFVNCTQTNGASIKAFYISIAPSSELKKATGLTMTSAQTPSVSAQDVNVTVGNGIQEIEVGEGSMKVALAKPESWTGVTTSFSYKVKKGSEDFVTADSTGTASLNDKVLTDPISLKIVPTVSVSLSNATIDFTEQMALSAEFEIKKIKSVKIDLTQVSGFKSQISEVYPLDSSMTDTVKKIWLDKCKYTIKSTNTLPAGNDIGLKLKSVFLNLDDSVSIKGGDSEAVKEIETNPDASNDSDDSVGGHAFAAGDSISFTADITMPGQASGSTIATLVNVIPGTEYKIALSVVPEINWLKVTIDDSKINQTMKNSVDTGVAFGDLVSSLNGSGTNTLFDNLTLASLPIFVYCQKPNLDIFDNIAINGKVALGTFGLVDDGTGTMIPSGTTEQNCKYLLGSSAASAEMGLKDLPDLKLEEDVVKAELKSDDTCCYADIASLVSFSNTNTLKAYYDISTSGAGGKGTITIKKSELTGKTRFAIVAYIGLPLKFNVKTESKIDVSGLLGNSGSDLLGRTEAPAENSVSEYISAIEEFSVSLKAEKNPLICKGSSIKFCIDLDPSNPEVRENSLDLETGKFTLTGDDIKYAMETYPFCPAMDIVFPKGQFAIARDGIFKTRVDFELKTDGTITLMNNTTAGSSAE